MSLKDQLPGLISSLKAKVKAEKDPGKKKVLRIKLQEIKKLSDEIA